MTTVKLNSSGEDVLQLQKLLCDWGYTVELTEVFDQQTYNAVCELQVDKRLSVDGVVGAKTWSMLQDNSAKELHGLRITEADFVRVANILDVEVAAVKAVKTVETGLGCGFVKIGNPAILFEGHVFWSQLQKMGLNPEDYVAGNEDILYPKWDRSHYKGGAAEYDRLERAISINKQAAISSASWGLFQIMGFNFGTCDCKDVNEFVEKMSVNEGGQLELFAKFIQNNKLDKYMKEQNWAEFARRYNGPSYAANKYDIKLADAYKKYSV